MYLHHVKTTPLKKHSRKGVITTITTSTHFDASFHPIPLFPYSIKRDKCKKRRDVALMKWNHFPCWKIIVFIVFPVIHSPFQPFNPSSIFLSFLPPLLSSFIHIKVRSNRDYLWSCGDSKGFHFTSEGTHPLFFNREW